jgi:hypothetical protein
MEKFILYQTIKRLKLLLINYYWILVSQLSIILFLWFFLRMEETSLRIFQCLVVTDVSKTYTQFPSTNLWLKYTYLL